MADDPTVNFLRELNDPTKYHVERGVPVFVPHTRKRDDGTEIKVTEKDLERIAAIANQRFQKKGVPATITPGHRLQGNVPEQNQPPIFGYALNYRVGVFGTDRQVGLLCDNFIKQECKAEAGGYPFRSAEYYYKADLISGIALLKQDPWLDMGVVSYQLGKGWFDGSNKAIQKPAWAPLPASDCLFYQAANYMAEEEKKKKKPGDSDEGDGGDSEGVEEGKQAGEMTMTPEHAKTADMYMEHYKQNHPFMKYMADQYAATCGGSMLGSTNAGMPTPGASPTNFRNDAEAIRYAKFETEIKALREKDQARERELAAYRLDYQRTKAEGVVKQLIFEGYQFKDKEGKENSASEVERMAKMTDEQRTERADEIRCNYQKAPVGDMIPIHREKVEGGGDKGQFTTAMLDKATKYMRDNKTTWEAAEKWVLANK